MYVITAENPSLVDIVWIDTLEQSTAKNVKPVKNVDYNFHEEIVTFVI